MNRGTTTHTVTHRRRQARGDWKKEIACDREKLGTHGGDREKQGADIRRLGPTGCDRGDVEDQRPTRGTRSAT